jgi:hypothetical protein
MLHFWSLTVLLTARKKINTCLNVNNLFCFEYTDVVQPF